MGSAGQPRRAGSSRAVAAYAVGMRVLVVDGANVVGSRPTGWWRDRAGAAERLHRALAAADLGYDLVVLVLEGQAKGGRPAGDEGAVRTVHAPGSGDDAIVEQVRALRDDRDDIVVVTADRALRERVSAAGGSSVGPSWLLDRMSRPDAREAGSYPGRGLSSSCLWWRAHFTRRRRPGGRVGRGEV